MPRILKRLIRRDEAEVELYRFPDASELKVELPLEGAPSEQLEEGEPEEPEAEPLPDPEEQPLSYAQIQADQILQEARRQADQILEEARRQAEAEAEEIRARAEQEGREDGFREGMAQAAEQGRQRLNEQAAAQAASVQQFLEKAGAALGRQMDQNVDDLRDLAIAIAEKVIRVSLRSSGEVISRMIQTAIDKRKRCEWVHIYIAECDAKQMAQIPATLTGALSALSGRVRIIPISNDESGTCIIEMPDEIIDASASTQLTNLKNLLMDTPTGDGLITPPVIP